MKKYFDYIIVGGGSAGCVLANRLSADPDTSVLLLEAGIDCRDLLTRIPALATHNVKRTKRVWHYFTTPQPGLENRRVFQPRGRILGGTSAINGMIYSRGHARDFDAWEQTGAEGWGFREVLPYFRRSEDFSGGASFFRGAGGPINVTQHCKLEPLSETFLNACEESGLPSSDDINGGVQEGFHKCDVTIYRGQRVSAASAYIWPILDRSNLMVLPSAHCHKVLIQNGEVTGVKYELNGRITKAFADREVCLCAGAASSPKLLMLSGIGPASALRSLGIDVICDLPVGQNLQDHLAVDVSYSSIENNSLARHSSYASVFGAGLKWMLKREGPLTTNGFEVGAMVSSPYAEGYPDIQCLFIPVAKDVLKPRLWMHGYTISTGIGTIESTGCIRLRSQCPNDAPLIDPAYLAEKLDTKRMVFALELALDLAEKNSFKATRGHRLFPILKSYEKSELERYIRESAFGCYHIAGSCRMGTNSDCVVNQEGQVYGVEKLRVCDASIMPRLPNASINAPTIMMAEKIADHILGNTT
ncbi:MAG: GMC family oxidoreductase N-terminal domain-containing protein [Gammaproteobacteria bacterium]|nr:GMC family oxidoreductase N-terminal domain-containing protein [Gammaproteobacteria bacterium]MDE0413591.1 GMC family oxidoreductase N-terminal domain-containing protein [Gammaproteobacteria bacterium]